ncbi:MAG: response regulator [Pseudomonadota bacterium]
MSTPIVLVVDDFVAMRDILVHQLKMLGITNVHTASSGEEALLLLDQWPFTLILSDWSMPGMSGLDLLRQVRRHPQLGQVPFILVTAEIQRERVAAAIEARVDDFLLKPFRPDDFARRVGAALAGQRHAALPPPAPAREPEAAARPSILVVDDTPANLTLVGGLLRGDYRVKLAASGEKALQLCAAAAPDLVLLDLMMPGIDGFEVCRRLKANPATAHIPVIFLTTVSDAERTVEGLALGAADYVTKPIEPTILQARVASALRAARAHEALREQCDLAIENARLREEVERIGRHDLSNPLAAIAGISAALQAEAGLTPEQQRQLRAIERTAGDALDMLRLSALLFRIESGTYQAPQQQVDLAALLRRIADESRAAAAGRGIDIITDLPDVPVPASGHPLLLYSMLHNLVKNAVEAVTAGQAVRIGLNQQCRIRIHNPGLVPEQVRASFFDKYATHGKESGSGLGTYSARLIAQAHGGTIAMTTSEQDGTVLTVELAPPR